MGSHILCQPFPEGVTSAQVEVSSSQERGREGPLAPSYQKLSKCQTEENSQGRITVVSKYWLHILARRSQRDSQLGLSMWSLHGFCPGTPVSSYSTETDSKLPLDVRLNDELVTWWVRVYSHNNTGKIMDGWMEIWSTFSKSLAPDPST